MKMKITKESLNKEIARLDGKIAQELEQMKHYAEWILDRIGDSEAVVNYGFSRSIATIETTVKEYLGRREAFRDIMNSIGEE
jgi:hypothetical protein